MSRRTTRSLRPNPLMNHTDRIIDGERKHDLDERRLLPKYRDRTRMLKEQQHALNRAIQEAENNPTTTPIRGGRITPGGDSMRLRGIPLGIQEGKRIVRPGGGAIPGTRPDTLTWLGKDAA